MQEVLHATALAAKEFALGDAVEKRLDGVADVRFKERTPLNAQRAADERVKRGATWQPLSLTSARRGSRLTETYTLLKVQTNCV